MEKHYKRSISVLVGSAMVIYIIAGFANNFIFNPVNYNNFNYTEFLINFEGGFVRRGLIGQLLFEIIRLTSIDVYLFITVLSLLLYLVVVGFFFYKFRQERLNWWLLFSPFVFGLVMFICRKDYLCYLIIIASLYLFRDSSRSPLRYLLGLVLLILGLFVHEAFVFYGVPMALMLLLSSKAYKALKITGCLIVIATFLILSYFKGNYETSLSIYQSWIPYIDNPQYQFATDNSIGAIGWDTLQTFRTHIMGNFYNADLGLAGVSFRVIFAVVVYYFITNFLFVFKKTSSLQSIDTKRSRNVFATVFLFSLVCLLPMFLVLSCDYGRLYSYATVTTLAVYLIVPLHRIENCFPTKVLNLVSRINYQVCKRVVPSKTLMVLLLCVLAPEPAGFSPTTCFYYSVINTDLNWLISLVRLALNV